MEETPPDAEITCDAEVGRTDVAAGSGGAAGPLARAKGDGDGEGPLADGAEANNEQQCQGST